MRLRTLRVRTIQLTALIWGHALKCWLLWILIPPVLYNCSGLSQDGVWLLWTVFPCRNSSMVLSPVKLWFWTEVESFVRRIHQWNYILNPSAGQTLSVDAMVLLKFVLRRDGLWMKKGYCLWWRRSSSLSLHGLRNSLPPLLSPPPPPIDRCSRLWQSLIIQPVFEIQFQNQPGFIFFVED